MLKWHDIQTQSWSNFVEVLLKQNMFHSFHCMHGVSPVNSRELLEKAESSMMMRRIIRATQEESQLMATSTRVLLTA